MRLCHRLVPRNVGPLVVGGGLCAQQLTVRACWLGVCIDGCQLSTCRILYIIVNLDSVSLAVCLLCSGDCQFSLGVIAVGLMWRRQSLFRVIYVMYISGSLPLHHYHQVC